MINLNQYNARSLTKSNLIEFKSHLHTFKPHIVASSEAFWKDICGDFNARHGRGTASQTRVDAPHLTSRKKRQAYVSISQEFRHQAIPPFLLMHQSTIDLAIIFLHLVATSEVKRGRSLEVNISQITLQ
jgi:hypothetical protein